MESSDEERPHDKFTRDINKANPLASKKFIRVSQLQEELNKNRVEHPAKNYLRDLTEDGLSEPP